ncbi:MAG: hypothetical protein QM731_12590 [Chitinophagaceae bacterium]
MKKISISVLLIVALAFVTRAQVTKTTLEINKLPHPAQSISFSQNEDLVKDALEEEVKKNGSKLRKSKGVLYAKGIKVQQLGGNPVTLYYQLEGKGKKKKRVTTATMAVERANGTFVDEDDKELYTRANVYLSGLEQRVLLYDKDQQIASMQKELKKLNDDLKKSHKDRSDAAEKKIKEIGDLQSRLNALQGN